MGKYPSFPLSLPSGLVLHLDAGSFEGKVQDGEAIIDAWQDESGQGNHADQLQGDPTWVVDGLNGEPVVRFDGDDMIWTTKTFSKNSLPIPFSLWRGTPVGTVSA